MQTNLKRVILAMLAVLALPLSVAIAQLTYDLVRGDSLHVGRVKLSDGSSNWGVIKFPALSADVTITAPTATSTLATLALPETLSNKTLTAPSIGVATGTSLAVTGLITSSGTAGIGYATGAGGTVTQLTSKSTGVTLSKTCGAITMNNESLAAATIVSFTLTNTTIAATDVLVLNHISGGTVGAYTLNAQCAAGSATINVRNNTAGALGEAIVIQFVVIKGVNS